RKTTASLLIEIRTSADVACVGHRAAVLGKVMADKKCLRESGSPCRNLNLMGTATDEQMEMSPHCAQSDTRSK
ncbi:hypothetical protein AVEN_254913-1, partial [Araneus ventricosus]